MKEYKFNLAKVRKSKGLTQNELASKLKISQQHISSYERGQRIPGVDIAAKIADALGVTLDELVVIYEAKEKVAKYLNSLKDK